MAIVTVPYFQYGVRKWIWGNSGNYNGQAITVDAVGEYACVGYQIPPEEDGKSLETIWYRTAAVSTSGDFDFVVSDNSTTAIGPGATTHATETATVSAGNTWSSVTLTSPYTVSAGEWIYIRAEHTGDSANVQFSRGTRQHAALGLPNSVANQGTPTYGDAQLILAKYDDGTWLNGGHSGAIFLNHTFNSTDSDAEHGVRFQVPAPMRVVGIRSHVDLNSGGLYAAHLYNDSATPQDTGANRLATTGQIDGDFGFNDGRGRQSMFTTETTLSASTWYRMTWEAQNSTDMTLSGWQDSGGTGTIDNYVDSSVWYHTEDNGAGGWTNTTSECPSMMLLVNGIDDGTGGGTASILGRPQGRGGFSQ